MHRQKEGPWKAVHLGMASPIKLSYRVSKQFDGDGWSQTAHFVCINMTNDDMFVKVIISVGYSDIYHYSDTKTLEFRLSGNEEQRSSVTADFVTLKCVNIQSSKGRIIEKTMDFTLYGRLRSEDAIMDDIRLGIIPLTHVWRRTI